MRAAYNTRLAGSMDLSEKWPLEEGAWLSHAGIHHFANTRGGMAAFDVLNTRGTLSSTPALIVSTQLCSVGAQGCLSFQKQLVERRGRDFGVRQTWFRC